MAIYTRFPGIPWGDIPKEKQREILQEAVVLPMRINGIEKSIQFLSYQKRLEIYVKKSKNGSYYIPKKAVLFRI